MAPAKTIARTICAALSGLLSACAVAAIPADSDYTRMPRDVRTGVAEMAIERVEQGVSRDEVLAAVQTITERASICLPWPGVWLDASNRRNFYFVRYDLMSRDWGELVAAASRARMQDFVDLGFLVARERPDMGPGVVEYTLTTDGVAYLRGSPYGGDRPSFCAPSQRRVVEITRMEWGQYPCGSLRVGFTHSSDDWPTWARTDGMRTRVAAVWGAPGAVGDGEVSLSRQWFRPGLMPADMNANGELRSLCYDTARQEVTGDDLNLSAAAR